MTGASRTRSSASSRWSAALDGAEGEVEAFDLGQGKPRTLADEIDDLATESAIDQELAALKERMAKDEERSESR